MSTLVPKIGSLLERAVTSPLPVGSVRWVCWRLAWGAGVASIVSVAYFVAAFLTAGRSVDLSTPLDHAIPFIPWTWWIYFPGYVGSLILATVAIRNDHLFFQALAAAALAQLIAILFYFLIPSTFPRPTVDDLPSEGLTREAILWFWSFDPPNNTFPSTHIAISGVGALALWHERNSFRFLALLLVVGVIITVHTTKQHYCVDAVGGIVLAKIAFDLVVKGFPFVRRK